jgi:hypothetical protein
LIQHCKLLVASGSENNAGSAIRQQVHGLLDGRLVAYIGLQVLPQPVHEFREVIRTSVPALGSAAKGSRKNKFAMARSDGSRPENPAAGEYAATKSSPYHLKIDENQKRQPF